MTIFTVDFDNEHAAWYVTERDPADNMPLNSFGPYDDRLKANRSAANRRHARKKPRRSVYR